MYQRLETQTRPNLLVSYPLVNYLPNPVTLMFVFR
jgi:hypothetical protein